MADSINFGRKARDDTERRVASLTLAGLLRPAYAGVFQKMSASKNVAWSCDLPLDGYNRHLEFKFWRRPVRTSSNGERLYYRGRLSGLRPFFGQCDFDLFAPADKARDHRLIGTIDLHIAVLNMTVMDFTRADGARRMVGLLEVERRPAEDGE
ncbi:MAG: hypothetical protein WEB56_13515 [Roseovarius sp.]